MISYRNDIQILRGLSILLVIFYHLEIKGFSNGYLGVDIFFVLSGFLMAIIIERVSVLEFYKKRLSRILPAYLVTILITTLVIIFLTIPTDANQRLNRIWYDIFGLSNISFWIENSYFDTASFKPLLNLWSLGVELQFYLIAPFLLPLLKRRLLILIIVICLSCFFSLIILSVSPKTSFFMMPTRLWEFLIGAFIAWYPLNIKKRINKKIIFIVSIFFLWSVIFLYPIDTNSLEVQFGHPGLASIIAVISSGIIISLGLNNFLNLNNFFCKLFIKLGNYSYSIYLTHYPIIILFNYEYFGGTKLGTNNIQESVMILTITFISSYFMLNYVESLRYKKINIFIIPIILLMLFLIGLFGSNLNQLRFSNDQLKIFNAWEDRSSYRCGIIFRIISLNESICNNKILDSKKNVLLLGDSHADSIKVSFNEVMENHQISSFFYAFNNPLMSKKHNESKIFNDLNKNNITNVVFHYSKNFYSKDDNIISLIKFIKLISENKISFHIIAPSPSYNIHIPKAMFLNDSNSNNLLPSQSIDDYIVNNNDFYQFVNKYKIVKKIIHYPHLYLCNDNFCKYENDYSPLYFDSVHLTLTGASELDKLFIKIAKNIKSKK